MKDINLLYGLSKQKQEYNFLSGMKALFVILLLLAAVLTGIGFFLKSRTDRYSSMIYQLQLQEASQYGASNARLRLTQLENELTALQEVLNTAQNASRIDYETLDLIAACLMEDSYLTGLTVDQNGRAAITGVSKSEYGTGIISDNLKGTGLFSSVSIESLALVRPADSPDSYYEFSMSAILIQQTEEPDTIRDGGES